MNDRRIIIFDLDGTIALCEHRRHFVSGEHKNWTAFFNSCVNDLPNKPVIEILNEFAIKRQYVIVILSGRTEDVREKTIEWLKKNKVHYDFLYMRPSKDYSPDEKLKFEMLETAKKELNFSQEDILCVFDDRNKVVDMWRKNGLTCFQVAEGNF